MLHYTHHAQCSPGAPWVLHREAGKYWSSDLQDIAARDTADGCCAAQLLMTTHEAQEMADYSSLRVCPIILIGHSFGRLFQQRLRDAAALPMCEVACFNDLSSTVVGSPMQPAGPWRVGEFLEVR